jgi:hypothetical protein
MPQNDDNSAYKSLASLESALSLVKSVEVVEMMVAEGEEIEAVILHEILEIHTLIINV